MLKKVSIISFITVILTVNFIFYSDSFAQTSSSQTDIQSLIQQIQSLQTQLKALQEKVNVSFPPFSSTISEKPIESIQQNIPIFNRNLYFGLRKDADVIDLQEFLTDQGYYAGPISGNYFLLTVQGVKKFQSANGIRPTGYFGQRTRAVANRIVQETVGIICPREEGCDSDILPPRELRIITKSDLRGRVGTDFVAHFQVIGGSGNYRIDYKGEVPPGLSFSRSYCPNLPNTGACPPEFVSPDTITLFGNPIQNGVFTVTLIAADSSECQEKNLCPTKSYGKALFTIVIEDKVSVGQPPVITDVKGPATLKVGQEGVWTVNAYDSSGGSLKYSVIWGDEAVFLKEAQGLSQAPFIQTTTFSHVYQTQGVFTPIFRVINDKGLEAKTSISVNVGAIAQPVTIKTNHDLNGVVGTQFEAVFEALGGFHSGATWVISAGALPPGLELVPLNVFCLRFDSCPTGNPTAKLQGTLKETGNYKFTITFSDDRGNTGSSTFISAVFSQTSPTLSIFLDAASPPAQIILPGQTDAEFLRVKFLATDGDVMIDQISIGADLATAGTSKNIATSFLNIKIYDGSILLGSASSLPIYDSNNNIYWGSINISPITVPNSSSKTLTVKADLGFNASGNLRLSIWEIAYPRVFGTPLYGSTMTVSRVDVQSVPTITSINPSSGPVGTKVVISGSGFTATGNIVYLGSGLISISGVERNSDGTLTFYVPSTLVDECILSDPNCQKSFLTQYGKYAVWVSNANGVSNISYDSLYFFVTGTAASSDGLDRQTANILKSFQSTLEQISQAIKKLQ